MLIAVIPARGNSQGVKKKNIKKIGDKPLIDWALDYGFQASIVDFVLLSTDDEEIVRSSRLFSSSAQRFLSLEEGEIDKVGERLLLHKRREEHATADSKTIDTILDITRKLKLSGEDQIVLLQATSPFRSTSELLEIYSIFEKEKPDSIISARLFDSPHPGKSIQLQKDKLIYDEKTVKNLSAPRQSLPQYYVFDGGFYFSTVRSLEKFNSFIARNTIIFKREGTSTINIDNDLDFEIAASLYTKYV